MVARPLVHAERERRGSGLVDDALHFETCDTAGILGRLALRVVEIRGHRDHRLGDRLAEIVLGGFLHFFQDLRRDLRRRHFLALRLDPCVTVVGLHDVVGHHLDVFLHHVVLEASTDQALDRVQGVLRVGYRLALGRLADQHLAVITVSHHRGRGTRAFGILDDLGLAALQDRHARVRGPEIDPYNLAHHPSPFARRANRLQ